MAKVTGGTPLQRLSGRTLGVFLAWAGDNQWRRLILLLPICVVLLTPGFWSHGPSDRDEARFAQASKQMLETGDFVDIRFQEAPRHKKPAGVYWAQAASASFFGGAEAPIWAYRIPSVLGAILASLLTTWAVRPLVGARAAFLAGAMTAGLLLLNVEARIAKTDAALLACVVAAMGALARLWFSAKDDPQERGWNVFYLWTAIGLGVLIKGPIILLPLGGALLWLMLLERSRGGLKRIGWAWGLIWAALLALPWFIAIAVRTDGAFFGASLGEDMIAKVSSGQEAHGAPPGYYLVAFWGTFWPWTALAALAIPWAWRWRRAPETAFLLGWILPTWILFELVPTKLPHYVLPTYPAICALAAVALLDGAGRPKGWLFWIGATLWALPAVALPVAFVLGPYLLEGEIVWEAAALGAAALIVLSLAWRWLVAGVWIGFLRASLIGAALLYAGAFLYGIPSLSTVWISERLVALAAPYRACEPEAAFGSAGYREPSLVFLGGTETRLLGAGEAATFLASDKPALVWIEGRAEEEFQRDLAAAGISARVLAETDGFNYNRGKFRTFRLYARAGQAPDASDDVIDDAPASAPAEPPAEAPFARCPAT